MNLTLNVYYLDFIIYVASFVCVTDKMKDGIIAKLANQTADFYGDAFKQCQYKENLPKVCPKADFYQLLEIYPLGTMVNLIPVIKTDAIHATTMGECL